MSNDSHLFRTRQELDESGHALGEDGRFRDPDGVWERRYEAKMIHQFDHRFATYEQDGRNTDRTRDTTKEEHADPNFVVLGRYWVEESQLRDATSSSDDCLQHPDWFIGFRDITNVTNERTAIDSIVPRSGIGNSLPILEFDEVEPDKIAALLSNTSAFCFDFATRQKAGGTHLNFFIVKQLPVLPPETYTPALLDLVVPRVLELVYTAWDLAPFARDVGYEGDPFPWDEERRALLRAELDGLYAHLYGLSRDDFAYILDQFPIVKRKDEAAFGEYRTKRLCLEAYDYFAKPAQTALWNAVRAIETRLSQLIVKRLRDDVAAVPEDIQAGQEAVHQRQGKPPRAASLSDFLGTGYLTLRPKVIKANHESFADLFASNRQVDDHISPLVALRNTLAHTKEAQISDKVRRSGEAEVRWFAERLGMEATVVAPPSP